DLSPDKPMTQATLYGYLRRFKIKPLGAIRQCPQQYPDDTPARILKGLGLTRNARNARNRRAA
ncbi:MAG TPA: hypothetical protein VNT76_21145, partial [Candidatus Binatus sp.]|nr:hypothetical protein [Candidatus Binatus sp.]